MFVWGAAGTESKVGKTLNGEFGTEVIEKGSFKSSINHLVTLNQETLRGYNCMPILLNWRLCCTYFLFSDQL
jgi:hypothetical protein